MSDFFQHPTAVIDEGAEIGGGTKVWHWVHISGSAKVGSNCVFGQNVFVGEKTKIGNGVKVQNNVSIYEGVELGDYVFCGPSMVFTNVINPRGHIERKDEFRKTSVGQGASLGANCTIICGNSIGRFALVGAGSLVTHPVPDYALVYGLPAKQVAWVCECGEKIGSGLEAIGDTKCGSCGLSYRLEEGKCTKL